LPNLRPYAAKPRLTSVKIISCKDCRKLYHLHICPITLCVMNARGWQPHRHLWADCLDNMGSPTSHSTTGLHGLLLEWLCYFMCRWCSYLSGTSMRPYCLIQG
jgi:hypothetical protein